MADKFKKGDIVKPINSDNWLKVEEVEETEGGFDYVHCSLITSLLNMRGMYCYHSDQLVLLRAS